MEIISFLGYIDPGTGSMLLTVILGVVTALVFVFRGFFIKLKVRLQGGKISEDAGKMPFVIFSDHKRYWNVFEDICDEFERREMECHFFTASPDDPALEKDYKYVKTEFIGEGNRAFARLNMMKANICLSTTPGLDVLQWKRSKDVDWYAHVYHAIDDSRGYRMFALDYYDAVLATGQVQIPTIRKLEEMRGTDEKEIKIVGCTPLDILYRRAKERDVKNNDRRTVLLAPSWGTSSILNRFGEKIIQSLLDTGYKIVIRPHPQTKVSEADMLDKLQKKFPDGNDIEWNFDNDNFEALANADILISDFSGVMFDYSFIFNRPFIYADVDYDRAPYEAAWFEDTPWLFRALPELGLKLEEKEFGNLKEIIDKAIGSEEFKANITRLKDESWEFRGEAYIKIVDYMIAKRQELKEKAQAEALAEQEEAEQKAKKKKKKSDDKNKK